MSDAKLVFVYNVDATPMAMLRDLHQMITVGSTDCRLCDVTYSLLRKDPAWRRFVKQLPVATEFRLRSVFRRRHPGFEAHAFPAIFWIEDGRPKEIASAAEIDAIEDLEALRALVSTKLRELGVVPNEAVELATP